MRSCASVLWSLHAAEWNCSQSIFNNLVAEQTAQILRMLLALIICDDYLSAGCWNGVGFVWEVFDEDFGGEFAFCGCGDCGRVGCDVDVFGPASLFWDGIRGFLLAGGFVGCVDVSIRLMLMIWERLCYYLLVVQLSRLYT